MDFSPLNNDANALANRFMTNGFWPGTTLTADGRVVVAGNPVEGKWQIQNNILYFSEPEGGCVDYKAYKLENNHLMFATDADHTATYTMVPQ